MGSEMCIRDSSCPVSSPPACAELAYSSIYWGLSQPVLPVAQSTGSHMGPKEVNPVGPCPYLLLLPSYLCSSGKVLDAAWLAQSAPAQVMTVHFGSCASPLLNSSTSCIPHLTQRSKCQASRLPGLRLMSRSTLRTCLPPCYLPAVLFVHTDTRPPAGISWHGSPYLAGVAAE